MYMLVTTELYRLSFSPRVEGIAPCLVFTIERRHLEELRRRLSRLANRDGAHAKAYYRSETTPAFTLPSIAIPHESVFGYGECGYLREESPKLSLCFRLEWGLPLIHCVLTIHLLAKALSVPIGTEHPWSLVQQATFDTVCHYNEMGCGHAVSGHISWRVMDWIRKQAPIKDTSLPLPILKAMQQAWRAVTLPEEWRWGEYCDGGLTSDGRFMLKCMGDACDIAIYPDGTCGDEGDSFREFYCHNLDNAQQQITLLAGLAKLCELARADE